MKNEENNLTQSNRILNSLCEKRLRALTELTDDHFWPIKIENYESETQWKIKLMNFPGRSFYIVAKMILMNEATFDKEIFML